MVNPDLPQPLALAAINAAALISTAVKIVALCHLHLFDTIKVIALPLFKCPEK